MNMKQKQNFHQKGHKTSIKLAPLAIYNLHINKEVTETFWND